MYYQKRFRQYTEEKNTWLKCEDLRASRDLKGTVMQIEKSMIKGRLRVSKVS